MIFGFKSALKVVLLLYKFSPQRKGHLSVVGPRRYYHRERQGVLRQLSTFRLHHWDGLKVAHPELVATTVRSATARGHTPSLSGSRVRTSSSSSSRSSSSICRTVGGSRGKDGNLELSERSRARSGFRLSRSELRFSRSEK